MNAQFHHSTGFLDVTYTSRAYATMSVSVCLSVCLSVCDGSAIYRALRSRCMRARGKGSSPARVEGSSRAMIATARPSCNYLAAVRLDKITYRYTGCIRYGAMLYRKCQYAKYAFRMINSSRWKFRKAYSKALSHWKLISKLISKFMIIYSFRKKNF